MANAKEIQNRISSIRDTMKITKAMYMISSTKLKKARKSMEDTEPYFYGLRSEISRVLRHMPEFEHIFFDNRQKDKKETYKKRGYLVITADKGMAGAYNHNVLKMTQERIEKDEDFKLFVVGELGRQYFAQRDIPVTENFYYTAQNPSLHRARMISERIIEMYLAEELDEVYVIFTRMGRGVTEENECYQLLPLAHENFYQKLPADIALEMYQEEFQISPSPEAVIEALVPNYLTGFIYGALVESYSCEQNARMMAMDAATKSAEDMLRELSIMYNRVRQSAITQEITEVCGGANALKRKKMDAKKKGER